MMKSIYCSNAIENLGGAWKITERLCRIVFAGDLPSIDHVDEHDEHYAHEIGMLAGTSRRTDKLSIIRSRREIVQHAIAMKFLIKLMVVANYPLDEAVIKYIHRLLIELSVHEETSGVYRDSDEAATHEARVETDLEYGRRIRDAKKTRLKSTSTAAYNKVATLLQICLWCISPYLYEEVFREIR